MNTSVLILEMNPVARLGLKALFGGNGIKALDSIEASNDAGKEYLKGIKEQVKDRLPDIILLGTDSGLSNSDIMSGIQDIRDVAPKVKIIALLDPKSSDINERLRLLIAADINGLLSHDTNKEELAMSIGYVIDKGYYIDSTLAAIVVRMLRYSMDDKLNVKDTLLSSREIEVLAAAAAGRSNKEIGERLSITETTVKSHFRHILGKLELRNRLEAINYARAKRLI